MKRWMFMVLLAGASLAHAQSPTKKELVAKLLLIQQPTVEVIARQVVERPAMQVMQAAGNAMQAQVVPERREALGKSIEADVKKFVEEANPILRERAVKLAPATYGAALEEKFSEDELKQLIAWLESPLNKKLSQISPELQRDFTQKLVADGAPLIDPKLQQLQQKVRASFAAAAAAPGAASGASSAGPAKRAPAK